MRLRAILLFAILALTGLAGCFGPKSSPVDVLLANPLLVAQPGRGGDLVIVASSTLAFKQTLDVHADGLPKDWSLEPEKTSLDIPGQKRVDFIVHVAPGNNSTYGLHAFDLMIGDSRATVHVDIRDLAAANATPLGYHSVFAANASVLATNDPGLRDNADMKLAFPSGNATFAPDALPAEPKLAGARIGESIAWRAGDELHLATVTG